MGRWKKKIMKNLDEICGALARISIGYLSSTTLEQRCTNPKAPAQLGN